MTTMALVRLCLRSPIPLFRPLHPLLHTARATGGGAASFVPPHVSYSSSSSLSSSTSTAQDQHEDRKEIAVSEGSDRRRDRGGVLLPWRDIVPSQIGQGLGNALVQLSQNINRLLERFAPSRMLGGMKERDDYYKLKFEVPGMGKEDLKVTVEDRFLVIRGERKEEEGADMTSTDEEDDDSWYTRRSYGYYNTSLLLPDDAKVEDIKAQVKDGVLLVKIPKKTGEKKNVRVVEIN